VYLNDQKLPGKPPENSETEFLLEQALHLPDVTQNPGADEKWWNLAERFLLESYPALDPESNAKLGKIAPTLLDVSHVTGPKKRRKKILYNIKRAFMKVLAEAPLAPLVPTPSHVAVSNKEILERLKESNPEVYNSLLTS
jgi:hypothetical protein